MFLNNGGRSVTRYAGSSKSLSDSSVMVFLTFYLVLCLFLSGKNSTIHLVVLGEILWLLFFLQLHFFLKSFLTLDIIFFFVIVLALITIDLGAALAIVILEGYTKNFDTSGEILRPGSRSSSFKSVNEGSFLRSKFGEL